MSENRKASSISDAMEMTEEDFDEVGMFVRDAMVRLADIGELLTEAREKYGNDNTKMLAVGYISGLCGAYYLAAQDPDGFMERAIMSSMSISMMKKLKKAKNGDKDAMEDLVDTLKELIHSDPRHTDAGEDDKSTDNYIY